MLNVEKKKKHLFSLFHKLGGSESDFRVNVLQLILDQSR